MNVKLNETVCVCVYCMFVIELVAKHEKSSALPKPNWFNFVLHMNTANFWPDQTHPTPLLSMRIKQNVVNTKSKKVQIGPLIIHILMMPRCNTQSRSL